MTNRKISVLISGMFILLCSSAFLPFASGLEKPSPTTRPDDKAIADAETIFPREGRYQHVGLADRFRQAIFPRAAERPADGIVQCRAVSDGNV